MLTERQALGQRTVLSAQEGLQCNNCALESIVNVEYLRRRLLNASAAVCEARWARMHGSELDKVVMGLADVAVAHPRQSPGAEDGIACWVARFSFGACAAAVEPTMGSAD